jgi:hypothetical protein
MPSTFSSRKMAGRKKTDPPRTRSQVFLLVLGIVVLAMVSIFVVAMFGSSSKSADDRLEPDNDTAHPTAAVEEASQAPQAEESLRSSVNLSREEYDRRAEDFRRQEEEQMKNPLGRTRKSRSVGKSNYSVMTSVS